MVKIISLTCAFLVLLVSHALAISSINIETINEAQNYGKVKAQHQLEDFLLPWISYEEKAITLNETAEHTYLYTTFLLMATDAREKTLNGQKVSMLDSERILTDYTDILSLSIVLFGEKQNFAQNAKVVLKQNNKVIKAYQVYIPPQAEKYTENDEGQPLYKAQCYAYFLEKNIKLDMPVTVVITTSDKKRHSFYFDLAKIK